jgi:urea transport system substrate-binding protein
MDFANAIKGTSPSDVLTIYTAFGHSDWREIVEKIRAFASAGKKTAVISTINGDANTYFYRELVAQKVEAANGRPHGGLELLPMDQVARE